MTLKNIVAPALNVFWFVVALAIVAPSLNAFFASKTQPELAQVIVTDSVTPTVTTKSTPVVVNTQKSSTSPPAVTTKKAATTPVVQKPKSVPTCIVTINGSRYNVQSLKNTHSGGNIFTCGKDMTATFKSFHGTNYGLIARYKI